jgi:hypothetical protein
MAYKFVMLCTPLSKDCQSVKKDPVLRSQIKMVELLSKEGKALFKEWGVPDGYEGIGHCILGYAEGPLPEAKPRKENYIIRVK